MAKKNNVTLKLSHALYNQNCVEIAVEEFSKMAEIAISKQGKYTEVLIVDDDEKSISLEFANYALFLTIQLNDF